MNLAGVTVTDDVGSGSLPPGVTLSSAGVLSGTPTTTGTFTGTIAASNGTEPNASQPFTITVSPAIQPVPALSQWGAMLLLGSLLAMALVKLR